jgi:cellulose synthase/poly-beta-1,6-N-acetylglucosamine synthase-like glycosyltransferase
VDRRRRRVLVLPRGDLADQSFYALARHPQISILIAAYNEERTIGRTLEAVMALDWPDLEVLVVDDCSDDRTADIVRAYASDPRVDLFSLPANGGKAAALNAGLPLLASDYVLMMDADGAPAPDALHWMAAHLVRLPHVAAVTGNPRVADQRTPGEPRASPAAQPQVRRYGVSRTRTYSVHSSRVNPGPMRAQTRRLSASGSRQITPGKSRMTRSASTVATVSSRGPKSTA